VRRRAGAALLVLAVVVGGCGGDDRRGDGEQADAAPSRSCAPPEGQLEATLTSSGEERTFLQDVPPHTEAGAPLVIGLHGFGASGALFLLATGIVETAHEHGFVLLTPDALPDDQGDASWRIDPASKDVRFIEDLIDHAVAELCVDPDRVHLTGHSQGGFLISTLACTSADRITSVGPVAGLRPAPDGCAPAEPVPLLAFHDTGDAIVPYDGGLPPALAERLGLPVDGPSIPEIVDAWAARNAGVTVELETTSRYDHGWPAEANELLWSFFSRQG